jgi:hypothetical protein
MGITPEERLAERQHQLRRLRKWERSLGLQHRLRLGRRRRRQAART